jgi:ankyrin repeat protein
MAALGAGADTIRLLLAGGADVTLRDSEGRTVLMLATRYRRPIPAALLRKAGARE